MSQVENERIRKIVDDDILKVITQVKEMRRRCDYMVNQINLLEGKSSDTIFWDKDTNLFTDTLTGLEDIRWMMTNYNKTGAKNV